MKRFLFKILCLFGIPTLLFVLLGSFFLIFLAPQYKYSYNASINDKINWLEEASSPKIILCGNSNLSFGINSEILEKKFNMPVVNLGLHGGLGNSFHEEMAKFNVKDGDMIIVCHSTFSDDNKISNPELAWLTLENNFNLYKLIKPKDYFDMLKIFPKYVAKGTILFLTHRGNKEPKDCYTRLGFNKNGDLIYPRKYDENLFDKNVHDSKPSINTVCTFRLNDFYDYCNERGATLLIAGYPILQKNNESIDTNFYKNFQKELQNQVKAKVISNYADYIYSENLFYNTHLHLTNEGAEIRTKQLCKDLEEYLRSCK